MVTMQAPVRKTRMDALPENTLYRDVGCEMSPTCLACLLEQCIHDLQGGLGEHRRDARYAMLKDLYLQGKTTLQIQVSLGMSKRQVQRIKAMIRAGEL